MEEDRDGANRTTPDRNVSLKDGNERILLDPPDWSRLENRQISLFAETVNTILDFGIFRPPLAVELASYRDAANAEMSNRVAATSPAKLAAANPGDHTIEMKETG